MKVLGMALRYKPKYIVITLTKQVREETVSVGHSSANQDLQDKK